MIAAIHGETSDKRVIKLIIRGLAKELSGVDEPFTVVTDNQAVRSVAESMPGVVTEVLEATSDKPHVVFFIARRHDPFLMGRLQERARKLRIPFYEVNGG